MDICVRDKDLGCARKLLSAIAPAIGWGLACLLVIGSAHAANMDGAWVNDKSACNTVFVKKNGVTAISEQSEAHGSGFIIDGGHIKGKMVDCAIKTQREDGPVVHLIAACATDVALSDVQFSVRLDGEDKLTRVFPGLPEMQISYFRCQM
jgi:hypothetical protein